MAYAVSYTGISSDHGALKRAKAREMMKHCGVEKMTARNCVWSCGMLKISIQSGGSLRDT